MRPIVLNARAATRGEVSGVERWATEVIPRLCARGPDRYVVLQPSAGLRGGRSAGQAWEQLVLPALAARLRAGVLFSPANLAPLAWPRNVVVVHDAAVLRMPGAYSRMYRLWHSRLGLATARRAVTVVTVSDFSRRELIELGSLDPSRVVVIPGAVDRRFHSGADAKAIRRKLGLQAPYVLTVGTSDQRKNIGILEQAAVGLGEKGIELVWAGGRRAHIGDGRPPSAVRALGYVNDDDLPGLYAGALAFVLPSLYEGFGLPCLEAMACGTPVVASNRAALPEVCAGAAILVDPDDPYDVTKAVLNAATDEQLRGRLIAAGHERASQATWERTADALDELLQNVAER